jgi:hypothetical protein
VKLFFRFLAVATVGRLEKKSSSSFFQGLERLLCPPLPIPADVTRECLEKREIVFYMFFMCFNTRVGSSSEKEIQVNAEETMVWEGEVALRVFPAETTARSSLGSREGAEGRQKGKKREGEEIEKR